MDGMEDGEYVEVTGKEWRSSYNKQSRPDPSSRTRNVIPKDRLTTKTSRYFTTDTSEKQRQAVVNGEQTQAPEQKKPSKYLGKNS